MNAGDTIVALATPPGTGGVAVVRLSGPEAFKVAQDLHDRFERALSRPRELVLGRVWAGGEAVDDALGVAFPEPESYTGENVAELQLHGGSALVRRVVGAAVAAGARPAEPGEFTKRAYLNGKIDLLQAEAVAELIAAGTETALKQAELKVSGVISAQIERLRARLVGLVAGLSANLDFGEEDIADIDLGVTAVEVGSIMAEVDNWLAQAGAAQIIRDGLRVAIVGLPNAGKSSLLNALAGYERAIVTPIAGTTRDTLEELVNLTGLGVLFVDTAGLRPTGDAIELMGVERSQQAWQQAGLVLVAASAEQDMAELRLELDRLPASSLPVVAVQTKADIDPSAIDWPFEPTMTILTSAKTGQGLEVLRQTIYDLALGAASVESAAFAAERHLVSLRAARAELELALAALANGAPGDVVAGELTLAAEALGSLLGESVGHEVINAIFANFCIGK